jgi:glutathione S-transferase
MFSLQVLAVASYACITLSTTVVPDAESHSTVDPLLRDMASPPATGLVLCIGDCLRITMVNAMVRFLASIAEAKRLVGCDKFEEAQVDSWLSFLWHSVELPLHAMMEADDNQAVSIHIHSKLLVSLDSIESQLKCQQGGFLVGTSTTIADICLAAVLHFNRRLLDKALNPDSFLAGWVDKMDRECHFSRLN